MRTSFEKDYIFLRYLAQLYVAYKQMTKWSKLRGGKLDTSAAASTTSTQNVIIFGLVIIAAGVIIAKVISMQSNAEALNKTEERKSASTLLKDLKPLPETKQSEEPKRVETVVQSTILPDVPIEADVVLPKFLAQTQKMFYNSSDLIEKPYEDSFEEYQNALLSREPLSFETSNKTFDHFSMLNSLIEDSGDSAKDFLLKEHVAIPDWAIDAMEAQKPKAVKVEDAVSFSEYSQEEANMLAREAMQSIPANGDYLIVLREILAARTEAGNLGIRLPEVSDEQRHILLEIARGTAVESKLAKQILSK